MMIRRFTAPAIALTLALSVTRPAFADEPTISGVVAFRGKPLDSGKVIFFLNDHEFVGGNTKTGTHKITRVPVGIWREAVKAMGIPAKYASENGSQTVRASNVSVYLCPSSDGAVPIRLSDSSGKSLVNDLSPGQYVASAGQFQVADWPSDNNGVFFRSSRVGLRDITDGSSLTMMAGERSRTISDATWVGVVPSAEFCTKPARDYEECRPSYAMVLAHTGPTPPGGYTWVVVPNSKSAAVDNFWSLHPGGCNFVFCDGSVRFLKETIDAEVFSSLYTRAGGEVIGADQF
jgi:prepilin-type processing-associated H-X9-DG protein